MSMETIETTKRFSITHGRVHFPDGTDERVSYVHESTYEGLMRLYHEHDDMWSAWYAKFDETPRLSMNTIEEEATAYSVENIRKLEPSYTDHFVAVAEVPLEPKGWLGRHKQIPEGFEPDVDVWEAHEWEAHVSDL